MPPFHAKGTNDLPLSGERSGAERVRCSRGLGDLSINVFSVGDPYNENDKFVI